MSSLKDFRLGHDHRLRRHRLPSATLSPSTRERSGDGYKLAWAFEQVVTGHAIGMAMPARVQPGQLAASLSYSAPISLGFFFVLLLVLGRLRGLDLHPDQLPLRRRGVLLVPPALSRTRWTTAHRAGVRIASATSVLLVTSYLRLVVSPRFAFVEAAAAQIIYLVGFSLAHFWEGFTGLAVTVLLRADAVPPDAAHGQGAVGTPIPVAPAAPADPPTP